MRVLAAPWAMVATSRLSRWGRASITLALTLSLAAWVQAEPFAYITNQGSHDVSVIDLALQKVVATVPVGRSPAGVAASSRAGRVFISNPDSKTISVIDMRTHQVVDTLAAGEGVVGIDVAADGTQVFAADWYRGQLLVFDVQAAAPNSGKAKADHRVASASIQVGKAPAGVAASDRAGSVFVAERDDDSVALVDVRAQRVRARVRVGSHPFALLFDASCQRLYALNVQSDDVSVIDTHDPSRLEVIATIKVGKAPYGAALTADGALLYVTNQHDDSVSVIDASQLKLLRTLTGFDYPEGVAAHADKVYVVNWMTDSVSVLDARSGLALASVATGKNSRGFGAFIAAPLIP